jgi:hypothetical protein
MDPAMSQALMTMLPAEVRTALEGGAAPEDVMQSMLQARMQAAEEVLASEDLIEYEEPWPELGWGGAYEAPATSRPLEPESDLDLDPASLPPILDRLTDVARALGACPLCLGDSPDCPACSGAGAPGWSVPDPEMFEAMVVPGLGRLQSEALRHAQDVSRTFPTPNGSNRNADSHNN